MAAVVQTAFHDGLRAVGRDGGADMCSEETEEMVVGRDRRSKGGREKRFCMNASLVFQNWPC